MARVKRAVNALKKRRTILERAEVYRGQRSRLYRKAKEQVTHSLVYAYNDRKDRRAILVMTDQLLLLLWRWLLQQQQD